MLNTTNKLLAALAVATVGFSTLAGADDDTIFEETCPSLHFVPEGGVRDSVMCDLNGDGYDDLVYVIETSPFLHTHLNDQNGSFESRVDYPIAIGQRHLCTGDFNGDGRMDIATSSWYFGHCTISLGNAQGGLNYYSKFDTKINPAGLIASDLDLDGHCDLAVATDRDGIIIHYGQGNGQFDLPYCYKGSNWLVAMDVGDVNEDGKPDLVAAGSIAPDVILLKSTHIDRGFESIPLDFGHSDATDVKLVDIDGDQHLDLVSANGTMWIGYGDGYGNFEISHLRNSTKAETVDIADFNKDGYLDIVTPSASVWSIAYGAGDRVFLPVEQYTLAPGTRAGAHAVDIDKDGFADILHMNQRHFFLTYNDDGSFAGEKQTSPFWFESGHWTRMDLNGDEIDEAIVYGSIYSVTAHGQIALGNISAVHQPEFHDVADLNNDNIADIIVTPRHNQNIEIHLGLGDFKYAPPLFVAFGSTPSRPVIIDVDGDGNRDLVAWRENSDAFVVRKGDGEGGFPETSLMHFPREPSNVRVIDFDQDGYEDLFLTAYSLYPIPLPPAIYFGSASGLKPPEFISGGSFVDFADLNNDTFPDIIWRRRTFDPLDTQPVSWTYLVTSNDGRGRFNPPEVIARGLGEDWLGAWDFDANGMSDIVLEGNSRITVLMQIKPMNFQHVERICFEGQGIDAIPRAKGDGFDLAITVYGTRGDETVIITNLTNPLPGDVDRDGEIDGRDIVAVLDAWGIASPGNPADVTHDGVVDVSDLLKILSTFHP